MTKYNEVDSWAYWNVPDGLAEDAPIDDKEKAFKDSYVPGFPKDIDQSKLDPKQVKYVLVGLNPGTKGPEFGKFGNFHGRPKSMDLGQHRLEYIPHYSGQNGWWKSSEQHDRIIQITKA